MKYIDYLNLFDQDRAAVAIFSTFNFDPAFFEARILNSKALEQAQRVMVFMDATEYQRLQAEDATCRYLNHRYLVVPVRPPRGVFHPKLSLLLSPDTAQIVCGSNNLTQAGCTHNLELLNSLSADSESDHPPAYHKLLNDSLRFFKAVTTLAVGQAAKVATQWLNDLPEDAPWLDGRQTDGESTLGIQLVSTTDQSIWDWLMQRLKGRTPSKVIVISPFYDARLALLVRMRKQWPKCEVDFVAQQHYSNIPVAALKRHGNNVRLYELVASKGRHAHAKLMAFHLKRQTLCLAGSANFTTAAFDGANVEACLGWEQDEDPLPALFDREIRHARINAKDFVATEEVSPEQQSEPGNMTLAVDDAYLDIDGKLDVDFTVNLPERPKQLVLRLKLAGQQQPAWTTALPRVATHISLELPEVLRAQIRDAATCSIAAVVHGESISSPEVWIIQVAHLTREFQGSGGAADVQREIQQTGRGLVEHLDELGARVGLQEVIDYLRNLSIRYSSGEDGQRLPRMGHGVKARDPFRPDSIPEWVLEGHDKLSLEDVLYDFLERHERHVLWRHARRGNLNGVANFLDVFGTMIGLLFVYHKRNVIPREQMIGRICEWLKIFFLEAQEDESQPAGYFVTLAENYAAARPLLRSQLVKHNIVGNAYAALLVAQRAVFERNRKGNVSDYLPTFSIRLRNGLKVVGLGVPSSVSVGAALKEFQVLSDKEAFRWF